MPLDRMKSLWRNLFHRDHNDADLDNEIRALPELITDQSIKEGIYPNEARREAFEFAFRGRLPPLRCGNIDGSDSAALDRQWPRFRSNPPHRPPRARKPCCKGKLFAVPQSFL